MINFAGFIFLLLAHYFSGKGILRLFKLELKPVERFCLSLILGVPLMSFAPCILQLAHVPITKQAVAIAVGVSAFVCSIPLYIPFRKPEFSKPRWPQFYEWPFLLVIIGMIILSLWRCYYFPVYARDMLTGPELLAEYTVREKTMLNSVFSIDLHVAQSEASANIFKSPYITGLQIDYKLLVQPFGQLWMAVLFVPLILWFYNLLRDRIHPFLAALILMFFMVIPEYYAYSYIMLYDYSNVIFFFIGFYFLARYFENGKLNYLAWVSFAFGIATYIRIETLMFVGMTMPLLLFHYYRKRVSLSKAAIGSAIFLVSTVIFYIVCERIFVPNFVPFKVSTSTTLNPHLADVSPFFKLLGTIGSFLVFSDSGRLYYGYYFMFFCLLVVADVIWPRRFNNEARVCLYGIGLVYVGFAIIGDIFPFITVQNTIKRGLFKAIPLIMLYLANSGIMQRLSEGLKKWETFQLTTKAKPQPRAVKPAPAPRPKPAPQGTRPKKQR